LGRFSCARPSLAFFPPLFSLVMGWLGACGPAALLPPGPRKLPLALGRSAGARPSRPTARPLLPPARAGQLPSRRRLCAWGPPVSLAVVPCSSPSPRHSFPLSPLFSLFETAAVASVRSTPFRGKPHLLLLPRPSPLPRMRPARAWRPARPQHPQPRPRCRFGPARRDAPAPARLGLGVAAAPASARPSPARGLAASSAAHRRIPGVPSLGLGGSPAGPAWHARAVAARPPAPACPPRRGLCPSVHGAWRGARSRRRLYARAAPVADAVRLSPDAASSAPALLPAVRRDASARPARDRGASPCSRTPLAACSLSQLARAACSSRRAARHGMTWSADVTQLTTTPAQRHVALFA
jgi:hypothetical protein